MAGLNAAITAANGGTIGHVLQGAAIGLITGRAGGGLTQVFGDSLGSQAGISMFLGGMTAKAQGGKFADGVKGAAIGFGVSYGVTRIAGAVREAASSNGETQLDKANRETRVAFVGGANDDYTEIVKSIYKDRNNPNDVYFEWTQGKELADWIDANKEYSRIVIGHSYGGDTAATIVAKGYYVDKLITVDPVGWTRPNFSNVAKYSGMWINYNSVGTGVTWANFVATIGGAYNNAPQRYTPSHHNVKLDHVEICRVHCRP